ncbi:MAG TPA: RNA-binding S4 domain-containing protein [Rhabdaerophilum sp.]|nr:RNA-binding S4 domain-containing protein [Rhabdaerophilum sp.]
MGRRGSSPDDASEAETCRLDKWIWFARFHRARETCADLVRKGHVRLNGRKVSQPGAPVRVGDVLTLALPGRTIVVRVAGMAERRSGTDEAAALYRIVEPADGISAKND